MSLDKAIIHGKEKRKQYRGAPFNPIPKVNEEVLDKDGNPID